MAFDIEKAQRYATGIASQASFSSPETVRQFQLTLDRVLEVETLLRIELQVNDQLTTEIIHVRKAVGISMAPESYGKSAPAIRELRAQLANHQPHVFDPADESTHDTLHEMNEYDVLVWCPDGFSSSPEGRKVGIWMSEPVLDVLDFDEACLWVNPGNAPDPTPGKLAELAAVTARAR